MKPREFFVLHFWICSHHFEICCLFESFRPFLFLLIFLIINKAYSADEFLLPVKKPSIFKKIEINITSNQSTNLPQKKPLITVGFAYETNNYLDNAKKKLENKKCDFIVLNYPLKNNFIFNNNFNNGGILDKQGNYYEIGNVSKTVFANKIIKHILEI